MDVSWHLLRPAERRALADLSVFRGGFRKAAAHAVAGVDAARLAALVDAALVHVLPKRRARVWPSRPPSWDDSTMGWSSCGRTSPCAIATPPWPVMTRGCNGRSRCPPARRTKCWRWSPGRGAYAAAREHLEFALALLRPHASYGLGYVFWSLGSTTRSATFSSNSGGSTFRSARRGRPSRQCRRALEHALTIGDAPLEAGIRAALGRAALLDGRLAATSERMCASVEVARTYGCHPFAIERSRGSARSPSETAGSGKLFASSPTCENRRSRRPP